MKKNMYKLIALLLAAMMTAACLPAMAADSGSLKIVVTIFPVYDWVMNVLGDGTDAEVTLLLDNGVDLHSYQPTAADILKISTCDLFVYVGGESDDWVEDALYGAVNKDMAVINLLSALGGAVHEEETVEGMEPHDHDHDHGDEDHDEHDEHDEHDDHEHDENDEHDHDHGEEPEYDEHVWLSLRTAAVLVNAIAEALEQLDEANAEGYAANAGAYIGSLQALDAQYSDAVAAAGVKTLLFGDRFPFRYLTEDYGLTYYAAFSGCSAETEASFETVMFLAGKVDELGLHAVMTIEGTDHRIAETIVRSTASKDQRILTLDSMQSATLRDRQNGVTYLSIMEGNLSVLRDALQ